MASSTHSVKERVDITKKEKQIFELLLEFVRNSNLQTQLRVAGGWVRDKLLGKECDDIDIALDNMCGREFCEKLNKYLSDAGEATQGKFNVIKCNPEQSKHLETANMTLFDVKIDFVNLRSEDYSESSRIPTVQPGDAEKDVFRRDLTINSLFYRINDGRLEDLTGKGIKHLNSGKIATPLEPKKTFMDDPLRVLRAIRFGARFGFKLGKKLKTAASDKEVVAALEDKISRERIGKEIDLMVSGNRPVMAMGHVSELKLFGAVFRLPSTSAPLVSDGYEKLCVDLMDSASKLLEAIGCSFTADQKRLCLYAALFLPLRGITYKEKKGKEFPVVNYIFLNSLKLERNYADTVRSLHIAAEGFLCLIRYITSDADTQPMEVDWKSEVLDVSAAAKLRVHVGLLLHHIKGFWRPALLLCMLINFADSKYVASSELNDMKKLYKMAEDWILGQGLDNIWEVKPLVNGNQIMSVLDLRKNGPMVGEWKQKLLEWQLAHPSGTEEECIDWMTKSVKTR